MYIIICAFVHFLSVASKCGRHRTVYAEIAVCSFRCLQETCCIFSALFFDPSMTYLPQATMLHGTISVFSCRWRSVFRCHLAFSFCPVGVTAGAIARRTPTVALVPARNVATLSSIFGVTVTFCVIFRKIKTHKST